MHMILTSGRETGILHGVIAYQAISAQLGRALERGNSAEVKEMRTLGEQALTDLGAATFLAYDFQAIDSVRDQLNYMKGQKAASCCRKAKKKKKAAA